MLQVVNQKAAREAKAIMKDKFPMMVDYFLEDVAMYINSIEEGLAEGDAEKIKVSAHTIKSSASQLGVEKMSDISKQTEYMASDIINGGTEGFEQLKKIFEELKMAAAEAEPALRQLVD